MAIFNRSIFILLLFSLLCISCRTEYITIVPEIENQTIGSIRNNRITLQYQLSAFGYEETGVQYYQKENPNEKRTLKAIRTDSEFHIEINGLLPQTTYILQVYYVMNGEITLSKNPLEVTTTAPFPENFTIESFNIDIEYNEYGVFNTSLEGDHLNNINLKDLSIQLGGVELEKGYPQKLSNGRFVINLSGIYTEGRDEKRGIIIYYQGEEILQQIVNFRYNGSLPVIDFQKTNIVGRFSASIHDQFYNFDMDVVSLFDENTNRFEKIADIPYYVGTLARATVNLGDKIFFVCQPYSEYPPDERPNRDKVYSQSFDVKKREFSVYKYGNEIQPHSYEFIHSTLFEHDGTIYQAYTLKDFVNGVPTMPDPKIVNYVARYNPEKDQFEDYRKFSNRLSSYQFISIKNQLYAVGLTDVVEQGYTIAFTLAIFKVDPYSFELEEVLRVGHAQSTFSNSPAQIIEYDQKALIAIGPNYYLYFDPKDNSLKPLVMRSTIPHMYFGGMMKHKGKYYLNTDLYSTNAAVYEFSIKKTN